MNDEGLADVAAANPFRLPRLHPGIGWRRLTSAMPGGRRLQPCRRGAGGAGPAATGGAVRVSTSQPTRGRQHRLHRRPSRTPACSGPQTSSPTYRPCARAHGVLRLSTPGRHADLIITEVDHSVTTILLPEEY